MRVIDQEETLTQETKM